MSNGLLQQIDHPTPLTGCTHSTDLVIVSCSDDGSVALSHSNGKLYHRLYSKEDPGKVSCISLSGGSRYLCSGGR